MKSFYTLALILISWIQVISGQVETGIVSIGIIPVTSSVSSGSRYTEIVQEKVALAFNSKLRFTVVDRSKLDAVRKEQDLQKDEEFIDGIIADQGKSIGAQYLVTGNIIEVGTGPVNQERTNYFTNPPTKWIQLNQRARLVVSMKLIEVATGAVKGATDIVTDYTYEGTQTTRPDPHSCLLANINALTVKIKTWSSSVFPVEMRIVRVQSSDKKGLPETILVTGGAEMDMQNSRRDIITNSSTRLEILDYETIDLGNGNETQMSISIGSAVVTSVQDDLAVCKITNKKDAALIQKKLNEGRTLYLRILSY